MSREKEYFNAFNLIDGIGPRRFKKLIDHFPSLEEAWLADEQTFRNAGLEEKVAETIIDQRKSIQPEKEYEKLLKERIEVLTIGEETYPSLLKEIYDAPAILYIRGQLKPEDQLTIGVVGSRKPSTYGQQVATAISTDIARAGLTVISGLALGTDTLAHRAALEANQRTIAVLGSGLGQPDVYPSTNRQLADKIAGQGAVISEYPLGAPAQKQNFPARNRIISGLSLGILVIEAADAGKDIYCEKPMTHWHDLTEPRRMVEAIARNKRVLQVGTQGMSEGIWEPIAEKIKAGAIGKVVPGYSARVVDDAARAAPPGLGTFDQRA